MSTEDRSQAQSPVAGITQSILQIIKAILEKRRSQGDSLSSSRVRIPDSASYDNDPLMRQRGPYKQQQYSLGRQPESVRSPLRPQRRNPAEHQTQASAHRPPKSLQESLRARLAKQTPAQKETAAKMAKPGNGRGASTFGTRGFGRTA